MYIREFHFQPRLNAQLLYFVFLYAQTPMLIWLVNETGNSISQSAADAQSSEMYARPSAIQL